MEYVFYIYSLSLLALFIWAYFSALRKDRYEYDDTPPGWYDEFKETEELALSLQEEILDEWSQARLQYGPFNSTHEGFAVLFEEFDELKAEVWKNEKKHPDRDELMRKEAIQVAAMALRFLTDCCNHEGKDK